MEGRRTHPDRGHAKTNLQPTTHAGNPGDVTNWQERGTAGTTGGQCRRDHPIAPAPSCDLDTDLHVNQTENLATTPNIARDLCVKVARPAANMSTCPFKPLR